MRIEIDTSIDGEVKVTKDSDFIIIKQNKTRPFMVVDDALSKRLESRAEVVMKDNPSQKQGVMYKSFEQQEEANKKITAEGKTRDEQVESGKSFTSAITALYVGLRITRPQWKVWYELSAHRVLVFSKKRRGILEQDVVFSLKDVTENDWEIS